MLLNEAVNMICFNSRWQIKSSIGYGKVSNNNNLRVINNDKIKLVAQTISISYGRPWYSINNDHQRFISTLTAIAHKLNALFVRIEI